MTSIPRVSENFTVELDSVLLEICEDLQLSRNRHDLAVQRYHTLADLLEAEGSPYRAYQPRIYPQGSMALGTTVKPIKGPHDLDFVLELAISSLHVHPINLLHSFFDYLRGFDRYREMTSLKNRCVRIEYSDEFYMDILPACRDLFAGGTCIEVPDRKVQGWKKSNPIGYVEDFRRKAQSITMKILGRAASIPPLEAAEDKLPLQLVVQLLKRWRDLYYTVNPQLAPISVVLTTLAGEHYQGEASVSGAMSNILVRINRAIERAHTNGNRLVVRNPSNLGEDLSERWGEDPESYKQFVGGITHFTSRWQEMIRTGADVSTNLEEFFGEPVRRVYTKRAKRIQDARLHNRLGVTSTGEITLLAASKTAMRPNTYDGEA